MNLMYIGNDKNGIERSKTVTSYQFNFKSTNLLLSAESFVRYREWSSSNCTKVHVWFGILVFRSFPDRQK